uniref:hypothetical protein n=1 Tax=Aeromonas sp. Ne-1 TaxID=1675689 RepID=UPI0015631B21|nr:hypothetical protein [Aeromonas sp. Ne-1]
MNIISVLVAGIVSLIGSLSYLSKVFSIRQDILVSEDKLLLNKWLTRIIFIFCLSIVLFIIVWFMQFLLEFDLSVRNLIICSFLVSLLLFTVSINMVYCQIKFKVSLDKIGEVYILEMIDNDYLKCTPDKEATSRDEIKNFYIIEKNEIYGKEIIIEKKWVTIKWCSKKEKKNEK